MGNPAAGVSEFPDAVGLCPTDDADADDAFRRGRSGR